MRKHLTLLMAIAVGSLAVAATAWAGFPHILRFNDPVLVDGSSASGAASLAAAKASTTSVVSDPRVFVEEIVVVGVKEGVTTRLTAPFEAVYVCVNGGGRVPSADEQDDTRREPRGERAVPGGEERQGDGLAPDRPAAVIRGSRRRDGVHLPVGAVA